MDNQPVKTRFITLSAWALAAPLLFAGCGGGGRGIPEILGEVNNEYLITDEFLHHFRMRGGNALSGTARGVLKRSLMAELVDRKLLLQEARRLRIRPDRSAVRREFESRGRQGWGEREKEQFQESEDDIYEQKMIETLLSSRVMVPGPRDSEVRSYMKKHPEEFIRPEQARLALIVVNSASMAAKVRAELSAGVPFREVAGRFSREPGSAGRGAPKWRSEDGVPSEVWEASQTAQIGGNSGPISTPYGTYFFRLEKRRPAAKLDAEAARDRARQAVTAQKRREAVENYMASLRAGAAIRVDMRALDRL